MITDSCQFSARCRIYQLYSQMNDPFVRQCCQSLDNRDCPIYRYHRGSDGAGPRLKALGE